MESLKTAALCVLALLSPLAVHAQETALVQRHLSLELEVDYQRRSLEGVARLTIENIGVEPVDQIPLLLGRLMQVESVALGGAKVRDWSQDVVIFDDWPVYQVVQIWVDLSGPLRPGESTSIAVAYGGILAPYTETGMQYVRDHVSPDFTIIREDALAYPTLGTASLTARRSQPREDFTFDARITVPDQGLIVAGAVRGEPTLREDGKATWAFDAKTAAPFLLISIAPYEVLRHGSTTIFHFADDAAGAQRIMAEVEAATSSYTEWFGYAPGEVPLTIMEIPEGWGSQASLTGGIIQTADAFRDADQIPQMYHELAHLWHPLELERPADRWNEGLATFLQWRVAAERDPSVDLSERLRRVTDRVLRDDGETPIADDMTAYGEAGLTDLAYRTGALFFYALYRGLGERDFDRCLGRYFAKFAESGSDNQDFTQALTECAPDARLILRTWFESTDWLDRLRAGETLEDIVTKGLMPGTEDR